MVYTYETVVYLVRRNLFVSFFLFIILIIFAVNTLVYFSNFLNSKLIVITLGHHKSSSSTFNNDEIYHVYMCTYVCMYICTQIYIFVSTY